MRVLVLGGDGFCGWPTALHLSDTGHEVVIVDNLSRRNIDNELEVTSLTPISPMGVRLKAWKEVSGKEIDVPALRRRRALPPAAVAASSEWRPDVVVHFAEQRAAPYSMKSSWHKRYTVSNNLNATNNLLAAIVESGLDVRVVHLGTMGVYGYGTAGMKIPEGYLKVKLETDEGETIEQEILYPPNPGSIYHMTKTQDQLLFAYYAKNDKLRITDLHQGIVWGTQTEQTVAGRAADQPVRLRRRLRDGAQPVPHAGGGQLPAHRARDRRPDPGLHQHPGHRPLRRARHRDAAGAGPAGADLEPDDRDAPRPGPGRARGEADRGHRRPRRQPAQRGRRERALRGEPPAPRSRARADHPRGGAPPGGHRDRPQVRRPVRPREDPLPLALAKPPGG